jgi:SWI/SNF-related matrix-associated actin-dependent regulator of chromatin subfamily A member 5
LQEGFIGWNKRHFFQFINMCELYGRDNCDLYTVLMTEGGKTSEEIQRYSDTFWQKYKQVDNFKKYIDRIEKGEAEIEKRNQIAEAIDGKWSQLITKFKAKNPEASISDFTFQDIEIKYEKEQEVDFE